MITNTSALIVVDMQNDFLSPKAPLKVPGGLNLIPKLNLVLNTFNILDLPVIFTQDWHPTNHSSFTDFGGKFPQHCIMGSQGAQIHPGIVTSSKHNFIYKGTQSSLDAFSGFQNTHLLELLETQGIDKLYVCGVAAEYCVKATIQDAVENGFKVNYIHNLIKAFGRDQYEQFMHEMENLKVRSVNYYDLLDD